MQNEWLMALLLTLWTFTSPETPNLFELVFFLKSVRNMTLILIHTGYGSITD